MSIREGSAARAGPPINDSETPLLERELAAEHERLRTTLDEAQALLASIVQSSDDAIVSKTLDGVIMSWNAGAQRLFGYTSDETIGRHVSLLIPPERLAEEDYIIGRISAGERVEHFETVRVGKDGRRRDISLTVSPLRDAQGRIIGASKIARDITDRIEAEARLRESEARHRFLSDLSVETAAMTDPDEVMATRARLLAEHLGVDRCAYAEVEDESTFIITGDDARGMPGISGRWPVAAFGPECVRSLRANEPYVVDDIEAEQPDIDHEPYRLTHARALICVPLHKAGKLVGAMGVHQARPRHWTAHEVALVKAVGARSWDSLERARTARVGKDMADRLALALEAAGLGDWSWDAASDMVTLGARAAEIFGVAERVMSWTALHALLGDDYIAASRRAWDEALATRGTYDVELLVMQPSDRVVWVSTRGRAQYAMNGQAVGMYGVVQDITEKKHLEQELRQRAEELAASASAKDDFIALLAHELRNPLAPLRTGLHLMRRVGPDTALFTKTRDTMDRQLTHMVRLIDDLLDVSRITRHKLDLQRAPVALAEVISHALETIGPAIEAGGHQLDVALPAARVMLFADLTRLAQVFGNLLSNSAKYTVQGHIWLSAEVRGGEVLVVVRDDGVGIPADVLPHIFEMFSQADRRIERASGGLGLGLALVKGLVEAHGGSVSAQSPGQARGATFTVRLPILPAA